MNLAYTYFCGAILFNYSWICFYLFSRRLCDSFSPYSIISMLLVSVACVIIKFDSINYRRPGGPNTYLRWSPAITHNVCSKLISPAQWSKCICDMNIAPTWSKAMPIFISTYCVPSGTSNKTV